MEFDRPQPADWLFVRQTERIRRALHDCSLPVAGLAASTAPAEPAFGGYETSGDIVVAVSIRYGVLDGPWASVDTSRGAGPLRDFIDRHLQQRAGATAPLIWTEGDATVLLDGRPTPARILRAGERWWAVRCIRGDVTISVAAYDWHPGMVAIDTLPNVDALLENWRRPSPAPVPEGEPHRLLVTATLEQRASSPTLWTAAVARQAYLADQTEAEAEAAVRALLDQLTDLHSGAEWFRDDTRRRERAITESLLYATRLTDQVSSRPAQDAWHTGSRRRWLHEWAVWASSA